MSVCWRRPHLRYKREVVLALLFLGLLASRLCHLDIVWVEEGYPAAAAIQILDGKQLYHDFWFDKPPVSPYLYVLWGAQVGLPLRVAGAVFVWLCCLLTFFFARDVWSEREGLVAAGLLGFFLIFGIPSAVIALAPDLIMILPHLAAVYLAWRGRAFWSGVVAGVGILVNPKAAYILVACLLWTRPRMMARLLLGLLLPNIAAIAWFGRPYLDQVWKWGMMYSTHPLAANPLLEGIERTLNWAGFQIALVAGAAWYLWRERSIGAKRYAVWVLIMFGAVMAGWRFFPRYYFALLPPIAMMAARGYVLLGRARVALVALLLIPLIRFGPRYVELAGDLLHHRPHTWSDLAMSQDSAAAAAMLGRDGSLMVWGYRPDVFALTRMPAGTPFLDSQPLTGVIADRHLTQTEVLDPKLADQNRQKLIRTHPTYIVDGLGVYNPRLAITNYVDLRSWLLGYREVGRTAGTVIYRLSP
ncbi:MAG TPA: hypothetical protein VKU01_29305 [Bryobacteraceae bacterium]|nr:hypothetical protein [Bryobacteraceae bacterium]